MPIRIIFAAIFGGALMLVAGFVEHEVLHWGGRVIKTAPSEANLGESLKANGLSPGIYWFPMPAKDYMNLPEEEKKAAEKQFGEKYENGPGAFICVHPTGEKFDFLRKNIGYEFASNVLACFFASMICAMTRPSIGFLGRWFLVILCGLFAWSCVYASYYIWYRFPIEWIQDELFCALLECASAGIAVAAIVKPREPVGF